MKLFKYLIPCFFILVSSCSTLKKGSDSSLLGDGQWKLIAMDKKPFTSNENVYISFDESQKRASGKAACNSFSGGYEMTRSILNFSPLISTKMACNGLMEKETQILSNLQKVNRYEIRYGLLYMFEGDQLLLTYKK